MKFRNCFFTLIKSLCDWSNYGAGWELNDDNCYTSEDEDVTLWSWNPVEQDEIEYWYGSNDYAGECWPGNLFSTPMGNLVFK